ncbi:MAG TPA: 4-hydroxybenzoate octaprenyltransferase [Sphaerochaeta sp.]|nr:4-hydroxybenzoate octaprenyltransferase [Sphaerochaeta sp.]
MEKAIKKPLKLAQAVMIQHTLFSLPFAGAALLLETEGIIPMQKLLWIFLAILGARNGANALNRLVDHSLDALNPRTEGRHLPSGRLHRIDLWIFAICCILLLIVSTCMLNWLCVALLPLALGMVFAYSYTKRFTWLCHYFLGATVAIAPMGTLLALNGAFKLSYFIVFAAVTTWVAGFDIIYATQDIEFDREQGLYSIPARFGVRKALVIASFSHLGSFLLLVVWGSFYQVGYLYYVGCLAVGSLLFVENALVAPGKLDHVTTAAYHINEIVSVLFFVFVALEVYLP